MIRRRGAEVPYFLTRSEPGPYDRLAVVCEQAAPTERVSVTRSTILLLMLFALAFAGCAGASQARPELLTADDAKSPGTVQTLQRENEEQSRRIAELETRLALLENEARDWRRTDEPAKPTETVRIGGRRRDSEEAATPRPAVPLVRLHEREPALDLDEPLDLPEPPAGVASKLDVVPLPGQRAGKARDVSSGSEAIDGSALYRAGLRSLRERRWQQALDAFTDLLGLHPGHALADKATYWRGEVHYAQRRYDEAMLDFQAVLSRFARSDKAADALLKLGLCHERLGDRASAERYFRQLREQYPSSNAARVASRENRS